MKVRKKIEIEDFELIIRKSCLCIQTQYSAQKKFHNQRTRYNKRAKLELPYSLRDWCGTYARKNGPYSAPKSNIDVT